MEASRTFSDSSRQIVSAPCRFPRAGCPWSQPPIFLIGGSVFLIRYFRAGVLLSPAQARISRTMANGLVPLAGVYAVFLLGPACSPDPDPDVSADPRAADGGASDARAQTAGGAPTSGGAATVRPEAGRAGGVTAEGGAAMPGGGEGAGPPPAVDGASVYALECHGDSRACNSATVPCFGVSSEMPQVAAGWACANRCASEADCSSAPSGSESRARCVALSSASHCLLVCQTETESSSCPAGMACYVPPKSPVGYCLWR